MNNGDPGVDNILNNKRSPIVGGNAAQQPQSQWSATSHALGSSGQHFTVLQWFRSCLEPVLYFWVQICSMCLHSGTRLKMQKYLEHTFLMAEGEGSRGFLEICHAST